MLSIGMAFLLVSIAFPGIAPGTGFVSLRTAAVSLESVPAAVPVSLDERLLEHAATANANGRVSANFRRLIISASVGCEALQATRVR
jgi:hypothetical protein